jgi:hypothetical protein
MPRIEPGETVIQGTWLADGSRLQADATCARIDALVCTHLHRLATSESGWDELFRDPDDGRLWELTYPDGRLHGGGPPRLECVQPAAARWKYGTAAGEDAYPPAPLPYRARSVLECSGVTVVLIDPDHYLADPEYRIRKDAGAPALRNLWAFDAAGQKLWEAELPESNDYFYEVVAVTPLTANAFSGYTCELDPLQGRIVRRTYTK